MRPHVDETALRLESPAYILENENVTGVVEGPGWTKLPAKITLSVRGNAERRSHNEEGIRPGGVFRNVHLREKLHAISHRYAELLLRIVGLGVEKVPTVGPVPCETAKSD
jgi:hypothetical protein